VARGAALVRPFRRRRGHPRRDPIQRATQADDQPEPAHERAVLLADRRATTGIHNDPRGCRREPHEDARLDLAETVHAVTLDEIFVWLSGASLAPAIQLDDLRTEMVSEQRRPG